MTTATTPAPALFDISRAYEHSPEPPFVVLAGARGLGRSTVLRELCAAPLAEREQRQGGGGPYYGFPIGPYLQYYKEGMREATCTMTVSDRQHGRELTGHLR